MSAITATKKPRRPKPVNYGKRRTLRFGDDEEAAVESLRLALSKSRGKKVGFSEAHRLLLTENEKAARVLAGQPESWIRTETVELPDELITTLRDCWNALSHSRGSLYGILRKVNGLEDEPFTRDEARAALEALDESKAAVARMEARLEAFVTTSSSGAAAQDDHEAA